MRFFVICRILSVILFSVAALGAQPSHAQTPITSLNIGIALSGNWLDLDVTETDMTQPMPVNGYPGTVGGAGFDELGLTLSVGYKLAIGAVMAGVIADITLADFYDSYGDSKYSSDYLATLRAMIGMQVMPSVMAYLTGGLAWMDATYVGISTPPPPPPAPAITTDNSVLNGWVIGLGGEFDTSLNFGFGPVIIRAEYLYGEFDEWTFWKGAEYYEVDTTLNTVRVGIVVPLGIGAGN